MLARAAELAEALPDALSSVRRGMREQGLTHPIIDRLAGRLEARAAVCARKL